MRQPFFDSLDSSLTFKKYIDMTKRLTQLDTLMGKLMSAGSSETELQKINRSHYGKAKRLAKKIGVTIEIENMRPYSSNYWVWLSERIKNHSDWTDDFDDSLMWADDWGDVYEIVKRQAEFIEKNNL